MNTAENKHYASFPTLGGACDYAKCMRVLGYTVFIDGDWTVIYYK